jgi:hypothetical protein
MPQKDYNGSLIHSACEKANNYPQLTPINTGYVQGRANNYTSPIVSNRSQSFLLLFLYICVLF